MLEKAQYYIPANIVVAIIGLTDVINDILSLALLALTIITTVVTLRIKLIELKKKRESSEKHL